MLELVNNTATAITLIAAVCLPLLTFIELGNSSVPKPTVQFKQQQSLLEVPLITEGFKAEDLKKIERMNIELKGLVSVFSVTLPPQKRRLNLK
jgi:hypothetical protein